MGWDDEDDDTIYKNAESRSLQTVLTRIKTDEKFAADVRADAKKTLAPYKLTSAEINQVREFLKR